MALIGDVLVKFVADFAEFSDKMTDSQQKLEQFGKSTAEAGGKVTSFIDQVKGIAKAVGFEELARQAFEYLESIQKMSTAISTQATTLGLSTDALQAYQQAATDVGQSQDAITTAVSRFNVAIGGAMQGEARYIDAFNQLGVKILDVNGKLRPTNDILQETATALLKIPEGAQRAGAEVALFGRSGQDVNAVLRQLAEGTNNLIDKYKSLGLVIDQETIDKFDKLEKSAAQAETRIKVFIAPFYASAKSTVLGFVADMLDDIRAAVDAMDLGKFGAIAQIVAVLANPSTAIPKLILQGQEAKDKAAATFTPPEFAKAQADLERYNKELAVLQDHMDTLRAAAPQEVPAAEKQQAELQAKILDAQKRMADALANRTEAGPAVPLPPTSTTGTSNPSTRAQQTQAESIELIIKRYQDMAVAAQKAYASIDAAQSLPFEDMKRAVEVQKQIADIEAKQTNKQGIDPGQRARLEQAIDLELRRTAMFQERLKYEQDAENIELKYGDGQKALQKIETDSARIESTHRATTEAMTRARKADTEAVQQQALAAKRYDDDLGSFTAGLQNAANAYARSNDLYSAGTQTFNALTSAMGEGLDVLSGKSTKTFAQIASDFANMLAKMALQMAVSQAFKWLAGELGGGAAAGAGGGVAAAVNPLPVAAALAGGGSVSPGNMYLVGEQGPEYFVPSAAGNIVPMNNAGGGSLTLNLDMTQSNAKPSSPGQAMAFSRKVREAVLGVIDNEKRPGGTLYTRAGA